MMSCKKTMTLANDVEWCHETKHCAHAWLEITNANTEEAKSYFTFAKVKILSISQRSPASLESLLNPWQNPNSPPKSHTVARKIPKLPLREHRPRMPEISPLWRRACAAALRKKRARRKPPNTTRPPHPEARAPKRPAPTGGLGFRSGRPLI